MPEYLTLKTIFLSKTNIQPVSKIFSMWDIPFSHQALQMIPDIKGKIRLGDCFFSLCIFEDFIHSGTEQDPVNRTWLIMCQCDCAVEVIFL